MQQERSKTGARWTLVIGADNSSTLTDPPGNVSVLLQFVRWSFAAWQHSVRP